MHVTLAEHHPKKPCLFLHSQSTNQAPPAPLESILVEFSGTAYRLCLITPASCRTYGEVMTDEQPLIMRMIFHLLTNKPEAEE